MRTPAIVSARGMERSPRSELLVEEKQLTRARDALAAQAPADAVAGRREEVRVRRAGRRGEPARPVRRPPAADRLPRLLRARRARLARARMPGLLDGRGPGRPRRPPERARTPHSCSPRARPQPDIERMKARMGWEIPWYTMHRRLRRRLRRRRVARHERVHPRRRPCVPHVLHRQPRRRGVGQHVELPRHDRARAAGEWEDSPDGYPQTPPYEWWNWHDEYGETRSSEEWLSQVERGVESFRDGGGPEAVTASKGGESR